MANPLICARRYKYTVDSSDVDESGFYSVPFTVDNLPSEMLDADGSFPALSDGRDIAFAYDNLGTDRIPVHVQEITLNNNPALATCEIWAGITLSASTDTDFYIFFSDSTATQDAVDSAFGQYNVYDDDYYCVIHGGGASLVEDATRNQIPWTEEVGLTTYSEVTGKLGSAINSDTSSTTGSFYPDRSAKFKEMYTFTFEMWANLDSATGNDFDSFFGFNVANACRINSNVTTLRTNFVYGPLVTVNTASYQHHSLTYEDSTDEVTHQVDGGTRNVGTVAQTWYIGSDIFVLFNAEFTGGSGDAKSIAGDMDEIRFSDVVRSTNFISTNHRMQDDPATFAVLGAGETNGDMQVIFNDLTIGDWIRIQDASAVEKFYFQVASTTETVFLDRDDAGTVYSAAVDRAGADPFVANITIVVGETLPISVSLTPYIKLNGDPMYTGTTSAFISIAFDFGPPQASIVIGDSTVDPQTIFDMVEDALITSDGMKWHSEVGSIVQYDDIAASGKILSMRDYWRLKSDSALSLNSGVSGYVESTEGVVVDGVNGNVIYSPAGVADSILGRNLAGGSDGGRTVRDALRGSRNRVVIDDVARTMTVYDEDDTTIAWSGSLAFGTRGAINSVDPS